MGSPVTASNTKSLLPTTSGTFCERAKRLISYPAILHQLVSYLFKEDGTPTSEFQTALCALGCLGNGSGGGGGGGPVNPNMPAPSGVNATDGSYADKIRVSWNAVTPPSGIDAVTTYKIYRSLSTNIDPNLATQVGTTTAPTVLFDDPVDSDLAQGSTYNYWVKATNLTETSAFSGYDVGSASAPTTTLAAISDLRATQGFASGISSPISLVWTPPSGATKYDIYRNTVNDYSTATKIQSDMVPQNPEDHITSTMSPDSMWDNTGEIVLWHFPPDNIVHYFFWVVAKKDAPPAVSPESNEAEGWSRSFYAPFLVGLPTTLSRGQSVEEGVDFSATSARIVLIGGAGGGSGAGQVYGAGGGAGGGVVVEEFVIAPGDVISLEASPDTDDTGNSAALTDGVDGSDMLLKINGVTMMTANGGGGGKYDGAGGGDGGAGGSGTGTATPTIYDGKDGKPGAGALGGATGYRFGDRRYPAAHYNNFSVGGWDGNAAGPGVPGGGSKAAPGIEVLAVGGFGKAGYAVLVFGA